MRLNTGAISYVYLAGHMLAGERTAREVGTRCASLTTHMLVLAAVAMTAPQRPIVSTPENKELNILGWAGQ